MSSSNEIRCPNCNEMFKVDETNYAAILNQVRTDEFEKQIQVGIKSAVELEKQKLINEHNKDINELKSDSELNKTNIENKHKIQLKERDAKIISYKDKISSFEKSKELAVLEAVKTKEEENNNLKHQLIKLESESKLIQNNMKNKHELDLKDKDDELNRIKENRSKLSIKMVGESLESFCESEYELRLRGALPLASFKKDNKSIKGSKGDYIFKDFDSNGNEIVSIMFEMKNEIEDSKNKRKNKDFYKKLDRDRRNKNCEYAVLVSTLEPENELFNSGMRMVYHEYPKMIVIRPNCFSSIICTLREMGRTILKYKLLVENEKSKNIDVSNYKKLLENFHAKSVKHLKNIFNGINEIIEFQNNIIENADKTIDIALKTIDRYTESLEREIKAISIDSLTKDNPTMIKLFDEQSDRKAA